MMSSIQVKNHGKECQPGCQCTLAKKRKISSKWVFFFFWRYVKIDRFASFLPSFIGPCCCRVVNDWIRAVSSVFAFFPRLESEVVSSAFVKMSDCFLFFWMADFQVLCKWRREMLFSFWMADFQVVCKWRGEILIFYAHQWLLVIIFSFANFGVEMCRFGRSAFRHIPRPSKILKLNAHPSI